MREIRKADLIKELRGARGEIEALEHALEERFESVTIDAVAETVADGVILTDAVGRIVHANPGAERLTGQHAQDLLGESLADLLDDEVARAWRMVLAAGDAESALPAVHPPSVGHLRRRDRSLIPVQGRFTAWGRGGGRVFAGLFRDLSSLRAAADALYQSERRFEAFAAAVPVGLFRADTAGKCLYVSPRWSEMTGYDEADALGDGWGNVIHPDDAALVHQALAGALAESRALAVEYRIRRACGEEMWVLGQVCPERDADGNLVAFVGSITDITSQKRLEAALRQSEQFFRALFRDNLAPMWVYDSKTLDFLEVSEGALREYGYSRDEFHSMRITDIRPSEDVPKLLAYLSDPPSDEHRWTVWNHVRKDGSTVVVDVSSHPLSAYGGRPARVAVVHPRPERVGPLSGA